MSNGDRAAYYFLPWVRYGLAQAITNQAALGENAFVTDPHIPNRLTLKGSFSLTIQGDGLQPTIPSMSLLGPGDVIGIDPREIVRTMPVSQTPDFPPHLFPFVEFDRPDFPWLFTPGMPKDDKLLPWIVLVVLPKSLAKIVTNPTRPLPTLQCSVAELPNLEESWAWAHAQYVGKPGLVQGQGTTQIRDPLYKDLTDAPLQNVSRLLCPRRLEPNKGGQNGYIACLVPAFENGRKAGLGEPPDGELAPAWKAGQTGEITLPLYYQWEFGTGIGEDFEEMVDRLNYLENLPEPAPGAPIPSGLMDVSQPGTPLPKKQGASLPIETALSWPDSKTKTPDPQTLQALKEALGKLLNAGSDEQPAIVPPIYGQWHAKGAPPWLQSVKIDPRYRVAAALGAQVIQHQQEQLVAAAWDQAAKVREANQWLRQQQLARAVSGSIRMKRLGSLKIDSFFQLTETLSPTEEDALAQSILSVPFRRMLRPKGPVARRLRVAENPGNPLDGLLTRIKDGKLQKESDPQENQKKADKKDERLEEISPEPLFRKKAKRLQLSEYARKKTVRRASTDSSANDPLEPVLFGPTFSQPMYEPLCQLFQDMLLPGIDRIPNNSVAGLRSNPAFIEAYLVGLNHEMSRELLWREFPTPLGQTYFQHFWDVRGSSNTSPDIQAISTWEKELGAHLARGNLTVLLIRGDLLLRYPNTIIYVQKAKWGKDENAKDVLLPEEGGMNTVHPELRIYPVPGITMLGFNLDPSSDVNSPTPSEKLPGWFFIFEEPPTETRFGLDLSRDSKGALDNWRELSWEDVTPSDGSSAKFLRLGDLKPSPPPDTTITWRKNSAHMAYITLQKPYRRLVHSSVWWGYDSGSA